MLPALTCRNQPRILMQIDTLIAVNWGQLPVRAYDLGTTTLLEGATGAGKSTLEDAIQTVLTAAHSTLYNYNAGQDEVSQTSRSGKVPRTLASYILGGEENRYQRPAGAHGYLAAVFRESIGEAERVFTAVVGVAARLESAGTGRGGQERRQARVVDLRLLLIRDHALALEDLVEHQGDSRYRVYPVSEISDHLRRRYPAQAVSDFRDQKKIYLTNLWAALGGRSVISAEEAFRAAKTFSQAMAYKEIKNIHEFVRNEILEKFEVETELKSLSDSIINMRKLRDAAEKVAINVDRLEKLDQIGDRIRDAWRQGKENAALQVLRKEVALRQQIRDTDKQRDQARLDYNAAEGDKSRLSEYIKQIRATLEQLEAVRSKHPMLVQKSVFELEITRAHDQYGEEGVTLAAQLKTAIEVTEVYRTILHQRQVLQRDEALAPLFRELRALEDSFHVVDPLHARQQLTELASRKIVDINDLGQIEEALEAINAALEQINTLGSQIEGLDAAVELLNEASHGEIAEKARDRFRELRQEEDRLRTRKTNLAQEIETLAQGRQVAHPDGVRRAVALIRENLPQAHPRVLCDLVEVRDDDWQSAIEGYLGENRFVIIVEPDFEAKATGLVKGFKAKVVQGRKAQRDLERRLVPGDSIVHLMEISDPIAKAYLHAAYGTVVRVPDREILRTTARGVTQDGFGSASYAMFPCALADRDLVFGASGRKRRLEALYPQLNELELQVKDIEGKRGDLQGFLRLLDAVRTVTTGTSHRRMCSAVQIIKDYCERMALLDLSESEELEAHYSAARKEHDEASEAHIAAVDRAAALRTKVANYDDERSRFDRQLDQLLNEVRREHEELHKLAKYIEGYDAAEAIARLEGEAKLPGTTEATLHEQQAKLVNWLSSSFGLFRKAVHEYNQSAGELEQLAMQTVLETGQIGSWESFFAFAEAHSQIRIQLKRQRDHVLRDLREDTQRWELEVSNVFTTSFCHVINNHIANGERQLDTLNRILKQHRFTEEVYSFDAHWRPDMERYHRFFMELNKLQEGTNIFVDGLLDEEHTRVRDSLMQLLLSTDDVKARRQLEEISDYRNYKTYDVKREREDGSFGYLSEFGTGSGGQFETPGYVLRAAAITSAYRLNNGDSHHCKCIVLDEAFTKMDEPRAVEVLKMLTENMGFQVVFAMPTKNAGPFYPWVDRKYAFSKQPTTAPMGELKTRVLVQSAAPNRDATRDYWDRHREMVKVQAALQFDLEEAQATS